MLTGFEPLPECSVILSPTKSVPGFSGGLVGVDIFFVISGFVITRLLLSGFQTGTLTLTSFYVRRVRRLAPALTLVLLSSFVVAYTWLLPADFEQFSKSLLATSLCISNIFFARQHGDYFAADAAFKPLFTRGRLRWKSNSTLFIPRYCLPCYGADSKSCNRKDHYLSNTGIVCTCLRRDKIFSFFDTPFMLPSR